MIDIQRNMLRPPEPIPAAAEVGPAIESLLADARRRGVPVIHVRNNGSAGDPDEPGTDGWQLVHPAHDDEPVVDKFSASAFDGTNLADLVDPADRLVIIGMQSEYCVRATALDAAQRGHSVAVVPGAHATYDDDKPAAEISGDVEAELRAAGVDVTGTPWA
jgi:nicotinamidase-related amidase